MKQKPTRVEQLARLANLPLTKQETQDFEGQLSDILKYVDEIQSLDIKNTPPTNQVTNKVNELRPDKVEPSLSQAEALSQAERTHQGYFAVPAILDE